MMKTLHRSVLVAAVVAGVAFAPVLAGSFNQRDLSANLSGRGATNLHSLKKVPLMDACQIHPVFCAPDGTSDVPEFLSAFTIFAYNASRNGSAMMTVIVNGSVPNEAHKVYLCPGDFSDQWGFMGCRLVGTFTTNVNGNGAFHMEFRNGMPSERYININTPAFDTVIANCPDQPGASCSPNPLF